MHAFHLRPRNLRILSAAVLLSAALAWVPAPAPAADMEQDAMAMIQRVADTVIAILERKDISVEERDKRFQDLFVQNFNVRAIGRFALGRHWRKADKAKRQQYLQVFETFVVKTYAVRLGQYTGERFKVTGSVPDKRGVMVTSEIVASSGPPVDLKWRIRRAKGTLKVVDVVIENISMALTQRQDFASVIRQRGGTVDGLIDALKEKIERIDKRQRSYADPGTNPSRAVSGAFAESTLARSF